MSTENTAVKLRTEDSLFRSPDQIVQTVLELNERLWHDSSLNELAVRKLGSPPECPVSDRNHLYCLVLLPAIDDPASAFSKFWDAFLYVHEGATSWPQLELNTAHLRMRDAKRFLPKQPAWAVVELGRRTQGKCVNDADRIIRADGNSPIGPELPLVGAVHPEWADAMNGNTVPYLYAGDIEVTFGRNSFHGFVPHLSRAYCCAKDFVLHVESSDSCCSLFGTGSVRY